MFCLNEKNFWLFGCVCVLTALAGGCGDVDLMSDDSEVTQVAQFLEDDPCSGYQEGECDFIPQEKIVTWQDSLQNFDGMPPWRLIEEQPSGGVRITFYPEDLNLGIVPTADGQGQYENEEHLRHVMTQLYGVDMASESVKYIEEVQFGESVKIAESTSKEMLKSSTGTFSLDALTDSDGLIYIGKTPYKVDDMEDVKSLSVPESGEGINLLGGGQMLTSTNPVDADFQAFQTWANFVPWLSVMYVGYGAKIKNYTYNGKKAEWRFFIGWGGIGWVRVAYKADEMYLINQYFSSFGADFGENEARESSVTRLRLTKSMWGSVIRGICSYGYAKKGIYVVIGEPSNEIGRRYCTL